MAKKKKKSGRNRPEQKSESKPAATPKPELFAEHHEHHSKREERSIAENDGEQLHSPWLPLIWMLIPLFACVAYGLATR